VRTTLERLKEKRSDEGFTLIELLIVIIILAILATIVIFAVGTTTKNAALSSCKATVKSTQTALEAYKAQSAATTATGGTYPTTIGTLTKKIATRGPWLKSAPPTSTTHGWFLATYKAATGTFVVKTKGTATGKATSTATVCKGA